MSIDWNTAAALVGIITAITAIIALVTQSRQTQLSLMADFLWRMEDRFDEVNLTNKRKVAAKHLLEYMDNPKKDFEDNDDLNEVLNFFESLGYYVRRRVLDKDMTWNHFGMWIIPYWYASEAYIHFARNSEENPTMWHSFEKLSRDILHIDAQKKKRPLSEVAPSHIVLREFLEWEAKELKKSQE